MPVNHGSLSVAAYHLRVSRDGALRWNGAAVDAQTLRRYLRQFAGLPRAAGLLAIEFEPSTPKNRADWVRHEVVDSGLCAQARCVEETWGIKTRVVS